MANDCPICLDPMDSSKNIMYLPCSHAFHIECALRWLHKDKRCPCCRTPHDIVETQHSLVRRRQTEVDYNDIISETLRIMSQPWTCIDSSFETWNALHSDTQGRYMRIWLVEHFQHHFERQFNALLGEAYITPLQTDDDLGVVSESPMNSDNAVLYMIGPVFAILLTMYVYRIAYFLIYIYEWNVGMLPN